MNRRKFIKAMTLVLTAPLIALKTEPIKVGRNLTQGAGKTGYVFRGVTTGRFSGNKKMNIMIQTNYAELEAKVMAERYQQIYVKK